MEIKDDASLAGLSLRMRPVLIGAEKVWKLAGQELCVTCGLDGTHSAGSMHYYGLAVDLRTRYFSETEKKHVFTALKKELGAGYDVVIHGTHIHVEARL